MLAVYLLFSVACFLTVHEHSFKVFIAPPQGVSYAKDIAEKYGVTFDKIKKQIDRRADGGVSL